MEATPTQIINYFSGFKQNLVPLFQRPYTWAERQWRTLWEDILAFYGPPEQASKSTHFMGAVVTMPARSGVDPLIETGKNRDSCGWLLGALQQQG